MKILFLANYCCAYSFCEKTSFFCFSNIFGLHLKLKIILRIQLHQVTFWLSHYTSLVVSDVSWSFPTLTSALTSEDESHQTSPPQTSWYVSIFSTSTYTTISTEWHVGYVVLIRNTTGLHSVDPFSCEAYLHPWRPHTEAAKYHAMSPTALHIS